MKNKLDVMLVESATPPTVEVDWEALAVYVRFRRSKVARTIERPCAHCLITVDIDRWGNVVGIETVGETQIEIGRILERAAVRAPNVDFSRVRYMRPRVNATEALEEKALA